MKIDITVGDANVAMKIEAYTDGGFSSKTKRGGWAYWYTYDTSKGVSIQISDSGGGTESELKMTSQLMEITALLKCIQNLPVTKGSSIIHTDSGYGADSFGRGVWNPKAGWISGWIKKGWKKADGEPVLHRPLFELAILKLNELSEKGMSVEFKWVKAHVGIPGNELVDKMVRDVVFVE